MGLCLQGDTAGHKKWKKGLQRAAEARAKAYVAAIEGKYQGQTLDARKFV